VRIALSAALSLALVVPAAAPADSTGGGAAPDVVAPPSAAAGNGGTPAGGAPPPDPRRHRRRRRGPVLEYFSVSPSSAFVYGPPARVSFEVRSRRPRVHVRLVITPAGSRDVVRRIDLGNRRAGVRQAYDLTGLEGGVLPQGSFYLRLSAGGLRVASKASAVAQLSFHWHCFPLIGEFAFGDDPDGRFGAPRPRHAHQGQDIPAPLGTPVVAPRGGLVKHVGYQRGGAGRYVVLHGEREELDFVFDHLRDHSITVSGGATVLTGQRIGEVGATGDATGPHLHFELWKGPWYAGGHPIDPLPFLRRWDAWS
jgi:hypothetical protein